MSLTTGSTMMSPASIRRVTNMTRLPGATRYLFINARIQAKCQSAYAHANYYHFVRKASQSKSICTYNLAEATAPTTAPMPRTINTVPMCVAVVWQLSASTFKFEPIATSTMPQTL